MLRNKPKTFKIKLALKFPCFPIKGYLEIKLSSNSCLLILFSGSHPLPPHPLSPAPQDLGLELAVDSTAVVLLNEYLPGQQCLLQPFGEDLLSVPSALQLLSHNLNQLSLCETSFKNILPRW